MPNCLAVIWMAPLDNIGSYRFTPEVFRSFCNCGVTTFISPSLNWYTLSLREYRASQFARSRSAIMTPSSNCALMPPWPFYCTAFSINSQRTNAITRAKELSWIAIKVWRLLRFPIILSEESADGPNCNSEDWQNGVTAVQPWLCWEMGGTLRIGRTA